MSLVYIPFLFNGALETLEGVLPKLLLVLAHASIILICIIVSAYTNDGAKRDV